VTGVVLRGPVELADPLEVALGFFEAYGPDDPGGALEPDVFDARDLRRANRGGARISAAEQAAVLARRRQIEAALREIPRDASLAGSAVAWAPLARLFAGFGEIRGLGFAKMTKALHGKRPALIPILDSVVQAYLAPDESMPPEFGEQATALVRSYKQDLDRNHVALREVKGALATRGYTMTEVRILDVLIWSAFT
jgi:uncharacterized protein DUF6308